MRKHKKQTNILRSLIILFNVIVLPIIIIGIFIQFKANHIIRKNTLTAVSSRISDNIENLNHSFDNSNIQVSYLFANIKVQRIANPNDPMDVYTRAINVNYVRDLLYNIKVGNSFVNNVRLYLPKLNIYYNASNSYDYNNDNIITNKYLGSQAELTDSMYEELIALQSQHQKIYLRNNGFCFLQYSSSSDPRIIVETSYIFPKLREMLSDTLLYQNSYYYLSLNFGETALTNFSQEIPWSEFPDFTEQTFFKASIDGKNYHVFVADFPEIDGYYLQFIPNEELFGTIGLSVQYSILFTVIVLFCSFVFILISFRIIHGPIKALSLGLQQIENENFSVQLNPPPFSDFQYLYDSFNHMTTRLDYLIQQELKHEILLNKAELKQLQAQINPHFLYNSFFLMNQMIAREMYDDAREISKELGTFFKYITQNYKDEVSLSDEYEHTRMYANIQARRFAGRINIYMEELPADCRMLRTPKLILQPLLENAFKYAMEEKIRDGQLRITFISAIDAVTIQVEDNGDNLSDEALRTMQNKLQSVSADRLHTDTTALLNIFQRLRLYYGRDCMSVSRSCLGGLKITITLPRQEVCDVSTSDH